MRKLFVSYARENKPAVDELVGHLATLGYDTWVDVELRGGQDWWDEILDRIAETDVFIAIYSSAVLNSTACAREFEWANALGKPVVPVAVEPPPPGLPSRFARRQIVDYSQPEQRPSAALKLGGAIGAVPPAPPLPDPLPSRPMAPLSYLTDIVDLITQSDPIDHETQRQVLLRLEPAFSSADPLEKRSGLDILNRFSSRDDLYADVDRAITRLKTLADSPAPAPVKSPPTPPPSNPQRPPEPAAGSSGQRTITDPHEGTPQSPPTPQQPPHAPDVTRQPGRPQNRAPRYRKIATVLGAVGLLVAIFPYVVYFLFKSAINYYDLYFVVWGGIALVAALITYVVGVLKERHDQKPRGRGE